MKHLKTYRMFESSVELTPEQVDWLNRCTRGTTWQMNPQTGEVDVDGHFYCSGQSLRDFKGVRFGEVGGCFRCENNQLHSLEGAPREVRGGFYCEHNQLTSLEGAPREVGGDFYCDNNQLSSLDGAPREVGGGFSCRNNPVSQKTLKSIFRLMKKVRSYPESIESLWSKIPVEDQTLLYRPEFEWVVGDERKKLDALRAYQGFKGMI